MKALLEKIPADLILLEPQHLNEVYTGKIENENTNPGREKVSSVKHKKIQLSCIMTGSACN